MYTVKETGLLQVSNPLFKRPVFQIGAGVEFPSSVDGNTIGLFCKNSSFTEV